ncbi:MAG: hypothetical protein GX548_10535 [Lentisphaerae bacterium]|nr:hypothetical protein [Lentisphaerota bacterium]
MSDKKKMKILVFGKTGCDKCKVLQSRLDDLLARDEWRAQFEKEYCDVETQEGIVAFCKAECVNPQRIPAFVVQRWNPGTKRYEALENPAPGQADPLCKQSRLYQFVGLQTDYSAAGRGVITKAMIESVLTGAREPVS